MPWAWAPKIHIVQGDNKLLKVLLWTLCKHCETHVPFPWWEIKPTKNTYFKRETRKIALPYWRERERQKQVKLIMSLQVSYCPVFNKNVLSPCTWSKISFYNWVIKESKPLFISIQISGMPYLKWKLAVFSFGVEQSLWFLQQLCSSSGYSCITCLLVRRIPFQNILFYAYKPWCTHSWFCESLYWPWNSTAMTSKTSLLLYELGGVYFSETGSHQQNAHKDRCEHWVGSFMLIYFIKEQQGVCIVFTYALRIFMRVGVRCR